MKTHVRSIFRLTLILIALGISQTALASYNFYYKLSSLGQDVDYLQSALPRILTPVGYKLIPESVNVGDAIGSVGTARLSSSGELTYPLLGKDVQNDDYALRVVRFSALKQAKIVSGWVYLVIARTDMSGTPNVRLNTQAERRYSENWKRDLWHSVAIDDKPLSFELEVRAVDLHLVDGPSVSDGDLPIWAVPRSHFPKATSAQIVDYARRKFSALLAPMGYSLDNQSVDISEQVVIGLGPGFPPALRIVEDEQFCLRSIHFRAKDSNQKTSTGGLTLVISGLNSKSKMQFQPNGSIEQLNDTKGDHVANLFLSTDVDTSSFPLPVSFQNLRLTPVFSGAH